MTVHHPRFKRDRARSKFSPIPGNTQPRPGWIHLPPSPITCTPLPFETEVRSRRARAARYHLRPAPKMPAAPSLTLFRDRTKMPSAARTDRQTSGHARAGHHRADGGKSFPRSCGQGHGATFPHIVTVAPARPLGRFQGAPPGPEVAKPAQVPSNDHHRVTVAAGPPRSPPARAARASTHAPRCRGQGVSAGSSRSSPSPITARRDRTGRRPAGRDVKNRQHPPRSSRGQGPPAPPGRLSRFGTGETPAPEVPRW